MQLHLIKDQIGPRGFALWLLEGGDTTWIVPTRLGIPTYQTSMSDWNAEEELRKAVELTDLPIIFCDSSKHDLNKEEINGFFTVMYEEWLIARHRYADAEAYVRYSNKNP